MEVKTLVVIVLTCIVFVRECQAADEILRNAANGFRYKYLGCFKDEKQRALQDGFFNARKYIKWTVEGWNNTIIDMCAEYARNVTRNRPGATVFAVQHWGECYVGFEGSKYDRYEESDKCSYGVGPGWTNAVYKLIPECEVNGAVYRHGQPFFIPQNPIHYNDVGCESCSCDRGAQNCHAQIKCDYFFPCETFIPAPQGKCCPKCACQHQGTNYKDGETWINRKPKECFECTCVSNQAKCDLQHCKVDCPNPIYEPDKCCPTCHPGAPTTERPFIVIKETTPRPPPVFPPGFPFPGNHKRALMYKNKNKRNKQ